MTVEAEQRGGGRLDVGRVIGGTFEVIGRHFATFAILSVLLAGLPAGVATFLQLQWAQNELSTSSVIMGAAYWSNLGLGGLLTIVTTSILQGALIFVTVQDLNGQKPGVGEALATGLRNFLPLFIVGLLFGLAVVVGLVLVVVPGIMIACAWCVATPALVADRTGVFGAFSRAADLTRGQRWPIFGLGVLLLIIVAVVSSVLGAIAMAVVFSTPGALRDPMALATNPLNIVVEVIKESLSAMISASLLSVLYVELRRLREGASPRWLAEIFS